MVSTKVALLALIVVLCRAQSPKPKPECVDEIRDFHDCLRSSDVPPPRPDFEAIKKEADACFENAGCTPPDGSHLKGPGGRAGPPPSPPPSNDTCFRNVHQKLFDQFVECMKTKDPEFAKNGVPFFPGGGPPPGAGGPPPPGGPPPFAPPPFGGPPPPFGGPGGPHGGPGGPPPGGPQGGGVPPFDILSKSCGDDPEKAKKAHECLKTSMEKHKPSKEEIKMHYDALCKAEPTCKAKLGKCEDTLKQKGQFACECHEQIHSKADEVFNAEESCKGKDKPPMPGGPPDKKPDCSKPPPDPCSEGFDKFYERISKFGPPPPAGIPPPTAPPPPPTAPPPPPTS